MHIPTKKDFFYRIAGCGEIVKIQEQKPWTRATVIKESNWVLYSIYTHTVVVVCSIPPSPHPPLPPSPSSFIQSEKICGKWHVLVSVPAARWGGGGRKWAVCTFGQFKACETSLLIILYYTSSSDYCTVALSHSNVFIYLYWIQNLLFKLLLKF